MNNKKLLPITLGVLIVLVLSGLGIFLLLRKTKTANLQPVVNQEKNGEEIMAPEVNETTGSGNIFDLIKLGKVAKCTYSYDADKSKLSGVTYISGKNMRGDFTMKLADGQDIESHIISDGEWLFSWSSAMPQGFRMKVSDQESKSIDSSTQNTNALDLNKSFDYKCSAWLVDSSKFEVPTDVTFADFSEMMKGVAPSE